MKQRLRSRARLASAAACAGLAACAGATPELINRDLRAELPPESRDACATVIVLFTTWCMPCIAQLDILRAVALKLGPRGLAVEAVALDEQGEMTVGPFRDAAHYPYPVRTGDPAILQSRSAFGPISGLPSTFILDFRGQALTAFEGSSSEEMLEKALEPRLLPAGKATATGLKQVSCPDPGG